MKLIKFRTFWDEDSFNRVKKIIETGEFWCSKLWNQNDPMEGVYKNSYFKSIDIEETFNEKNGYMMCSFSCSNKNDRTEEKGIPEINPIQNPLLWGYYTNGYKGIAIEIEIDKSKLHEIEYVEEKEFSKNMNGAITIITRKLKNWIHEGEFRFLKQGVPEGSYSIGKIIKVYFGNPYGETSNYKNIVQNSKSLRTYLQFKEELEKVCYKEGFRKENNSKSNLIIWSKES